MVALGTLFSIVLGILTGMISAWRRGTLVDKVGLWGSLAFYSMPPQWLGLIVVLSVAGKLGLPTSGIKRPDARDPRQPVGVDDRASTG